MSRSREGTSAPEVIERLAAAVRSERLTERTIALIDTPSVAGTEGAAAELYASYLIEAGLEVEFDREFDESPSVVARRRGAQDGRTLQLAGHLDTVSTPQASSRLVDGIIVGRGACDMKGGLAVIAEVAQVLAEFDVRLGGSMLVTAYGQHEEAATGRALHAPLVSLLKRGIKGDACLIPEGPHRELPLAGRGLVIFEVHFSRQGEPVHEVLCGPQPPPNPLTACVRFASLLELQSRGWRVTHPLAGPESFFIGSIKGGDYFNRIPSEASLWGTRRYPTGRSYPVVARELNELAERAAEEVGCAARVDLQKSGQPFAIEENEPLVLALRNAYLEVVGEELSFAGMAYSGDVSQFVNEGGVPALYHGTDQTTAHSDEESVAVDDLVRCARVFLGAVINYLGVMP